MAWGLVASAVASKVGSSMVWHIPCTHSSPIGSTSSRAPQWSSQNSAWWSSRYFSRKSMYCGGRADVELQVLQDDVDGVAPEAEQLLGPHRVDRAGGHPLVDGDVLGALAVDAVLEQQWYADAVLEVAVEQVLPEEHRELAAVERGEGGVRGGGHGAEA